MASSLLSLGSQALKIGTSVMAGRGEPQRSYLWEVFPTNSPMDSNLQIFAKSITIPSQSSELMEYNFMGDKFMFQGKDTSSKTCNLTFWDNQQLKNYTALLDWFNMTGNRFPNGTTGGSLVKIGPEGYAGNLHIRLLDVTTFQYTAELLLRNAFPTEIGEINLAYEGDIIEFSATFAYDWFEPGKMKYKQTVWTDAQKVENLL